MFVPLLIVSLLTLLAYWKWKQNAHFWELEKKIPGPSRYKIFSNFTEIRNNTLQFFVRCAALYGPLFKVWMGNNLFVTLTQPEDLEILLRDTKNIKKTSNYKPLAPWLGNGLITATGQHWHTHRKTLTPAFHFNILEQFVHIFNKKTKTLCKTLSDSNGKEVDIVPIITKYTLDAIMETSMGIQGDDDTKLEYSNQLIKLEENLINMTFNPFLRIPFVYKHSKLGKENRQCFDYINNYCRNVIIERKKLLENVEAEEVDEIGRKKRLAFLDILIIGQKAGNGFTDQDILEEANTFMFAGHDTTASAISFSIYALADNPSVQEKVYDEIVALFGEDADDEITLKQLNNTHYLDMFVKESLRMYPPVPQYSRLLENDLQLGNYTVPASTSVIFHAFVVHRNAKYFPQPDHFNPENFSMENTKSRHPYAFIPFSAGPRNCIGQRYALTEIKLTIVKLLQRFRIVLARKLDANDIDNRLTLSSKRGICVKFIPRIK